jgi:hypothetical protein
MAIQPVPSQLLLPVGRGSEWVSADIQRLFDAIPGRSGAISLAQLAALARVAGTVSEPHPRWDRYRIANHDQRTVADIARDVEQLGFEFRLEMDAPGVRRVLYSAACREPGPELRKARKELGKDYREVAATSRVHPTLVTHRERPRPIGHSIELGSVADEVRALDGVIRAFACTSFLKLPLAITQRASPEPMHPPCLPVLLQLTPRQMAAATNAPFLTEPARTPARQRLTSLDQGFPPMLSTLQVLSRTLPAEWYLQVWWPESGQRTTLSTPWRQGVLLRELRLLADLSLSDLGDKAGVSAVAIDNIEKKMTDPGEDLSTRKLGGIVRALGGSLHVIFVVNGAPCELVLPPARPSLRSPK